MSVSLTDAINSSMPSSIRDYDLTCCDSFSTVKRYAVASWPVANMALG